MDKNKAFTFIELVVVIGIMVFLTGITLAYYNNQNTTEGLKSDAQKLIDIIDLTRKRATSSEKPSSCTNLGGYNIVFLTAKSYQVQQCCDGSCSNLLPTYNTDSSIVQSQTIGLQSFTGSISPDNTNILFKKNSSCYRVSVDSSGATASSIACP